MNDTKIIFLGAGPGDPELLTIRGRRLLAQADTVVFAGSLVSKAILEFCPQAELVDSAPLCLDDIVKIMVKRSREGRHVVRLHSGDPSLYGAIKEQIAKLRQANVEFEVVPGVSSLSAAAAVLASELTVPEVSQTVIITRAAGRTPVPELEDIGSLAAHHATMAIFLSATLVDDVQKKLLTGYAPDTPVAVVHNASRPDQKIVRTTVENLAADIATAGIDRTAIIFVGAALAQEGEESLLYKEGFSHGYRE
ncbi:MAG: precorrin-4 C(11)-methyltransferase [Thermoleophilia bacterium]|nr:precorrin-4 C(11)-methyltransferase [Thermoleophilia bacterium]